MTCSRCGSERHDAPVTWRDIDPDLTGRDTCRVDATACYLGCSARTLYDAFARWERAHDLDEPAPRGMFRVGRKILIATVILGAVTGRTGAQKTDETPPKNGKPTGRRRWRIFRGHDEGGAA